jgi:hypothetical protein
MIEKVKIKIEENEWAEAPVEVRHRILELMKEYGYDTTVLEVLEDDMKEPTIDDIYKQFYGDDE